MAEIDLKDPARFPAWTTDTIRYADLDPNDHVNNGAINAYLEDGRVRFRNEHLAVVAGGVLAGFVLARYVIEYHAPLHFPGSVDVGTGVLRVGRSSYTLGQGVFREGRCVASAEVVTVRVDPKTGRGTNLDEAFRAVLESLRVRAD